MKTKIYILFLLVVIKSALVAQSFCGLYLTAEDFHIGKLSHSSKNSKLKLHEIFKKDIIEVRANDSLYTYLKKDIYGYHSNEGIDYRFINEKAYTILNPGETILLYSLLATPTMKGQSPSYHYYFSNDYKSAILPLNLRNIESSFLTNKKFLEFIEIHFSDNSNLLEYDNIHKIYKINRLLNLSENE
jgi:hypothetical protein